MDNAIYISLSRQTALFREMEVTSNNLANVNTTGYSAQKMVFDDYLAKNGKLKDAYANDVSTYRDTTPGELKITGNPFDLAVSGAGYFQVSTPLGTRYTRAGNFQVDPQGTLVNVNGYAVLGQDGGQIIIPSNVSNVVINGSGQIIADGEQVGQVGVMAFENPQALKRLGNSLYSAEETPAPDQISRVVQGGIEASDVNAVNELVKTMEVSRAVGNTAKFIETIYDLERKTSSAYTRAVNA